jgi:hypothetical protein
METKSLTVPIYGNHLHIVIIENWDEDIIKVNKKFYNNFTKNDEVLGLSQQRGQSTLIIINVERHKKIYSGNIEIEIIATIAHEAVHACNTIFESKGIRLDVNNDEPQAYFVDYLVKEIYKCYLKHKKNELTIHTGK